MKHIENAQTTSESSDLCTTCTDGSECQLQIPAWPKLEQVAPNVETQATLRNYHILQTIGKGYLSK